MARQIRRWSLEPLEERCTPALFGIPWPNPGHLTLSLAPDGTSVGGVASDLSQLLNSEIPNGNWRLEILRAYQTWAVQANINIGYVPDLGTPSGFGAIQGSLFKGDLRVVARPLGSDVVSITTPYDTYNSWSGESLLNANDTFSIGAAPGTFDLYTIMLHEVGHALGIPDNSDPTSAMYDGYNGVRTGLNAGDVAAVQALYGPRTPDRFEGATGNNTPATAAPLLFTRSVADFNGTDGTGGATPYVAIADITNGGEVDYYQVTTRSDTGSFTLMLRTSGISLLTPKVTVYDASGNAVGSASSTDPTSGNLQVTVSAAQPNAAYTVRVEAAQPGAFGIGAYRLAVGYDAVNAVYANALAGLIPTAHSNNTFGTATFLGTEVAKTTDRWDFLTPGSILNASDVNVYRIHTDAQPPGTLIATAWSAGFFPVSPVVQVFDGNGNPVGSAVFSVDCRSETVQVTGIAANADYYIQVTNGLVQGLLTQGTFTLGVDLGSTPLTSTDYGSKTLSQGQAQDFVTLQVNETQLLHLDLSLDGQGSALVLGARLTIYDSHYNVVYSRVVLAGKTLRADLVLPQGTYVARVVAATQSGAALPPVVYDLDGNTRSDPIGPDPTDPTNNPPDPPPPPIVTGPTDTTTDTTITTTDTGDGTVF
jgi:hypothetical protein